MNSIRETIIRSLCMKVQRITNNGGKLHENINNDDYESRTVKTLMYCMSNVCPVFAPIAALLRNSVAISLQFHK